MTRISEGEAEGFGQVSNTSIMPTGKAVCHVVKAIRKTLKFSNMEDARLTLL